jgi:hypothetical protein
MPPIRDSCHGISAPTPLGRSLSLSISLFFFSSHRHRTAVRYPHSQTETQAPDGLCLLLLGSIPIAAFVHACGAVRAANSSSMLTFYRLPVRFPQVSPHTSLPPSRVRPCGLAPSHRPEIAPPQPQYPSGIMTAVPFQQAAKTPPQQRTDISQTDMRSGPSDFGPRPAGRRDFPILICGGWAGGLTGWGLD